MKLTFLGTSSGLASPKRNASAILAEWEDTAVLFDAGENATGQMLKKGINPESVNAVVISHTHPDHCAGIFQFLQHQHLSLRKRPLKIFLPCAKADCFYDMLDWFYLKPEQWSFGLSVEKMKNQSEIHMNGINIRALANSHIPDGCSFSFVINEKDGSACFLTADTGMISDFPESIDFDVIISECTHINEEDVYRFMQENMCRKVIFTHIPEEKYLQAERISGFHDSMHFIYAYDGMEIEV